MLEFSFFFFRHIATSGGLLIKSYWWSVNVHELKNELSGRYFIPLCLKHVAPLVIYVRSSPSDLKCLDYR